MFEYINQYKYTLYFHKYQSTSVTLPATSGIIREHPAFDPGWNKIINITGVVRDNPGRYSFAGFILSSAAGVSVTATIISPQIVPDHPSNLPGWSWALPGVRETAA
jgi:hypothetical protein